MHTTSLILCNKDYMHEIFQSNYKFKNWVKMKYYHCGQFLKFNIQMRANLVFYSISKVNCMFYFFPFTFRFRDFQIVLRKKEKKKKNQTNKKLVDILGVTYSCVTFSNFALEKIVVLVCMMLLFPKILPRQLHHSYSSA